MDREQSTMHSTNSVEKARSCPPSLGYSLRDRKLAIAICWGLIIADSCLLAVVLYYPLWYATSLSKTNVMAIVSSLSGIVSLFQFVWRGWVLKRDESARPIGGTKWSFDIFQWVYALAVVGVTLELVFGTIPNYPIVALCSMPVSTVVFIAAGCDLSCTLCYFMNLRTPFRISSVARGEHFRPGVYSLIEDVIAVEGSGGRAFREALDKRYQASPEFRNMLAKISLFWSLPALAVAGGVTAVIWTVPKSVAFGVGWCAPFVWAFVWAVLTVMWVPRMLRREEYAWKMANTRV